MAADFDRDGDLDTAITNSYVAGPVLVLLGDGRGGFSKPSPYPTDEYPQALETGDFNRDGFPDLAFTFQNSPTVGVLIGGPAGQFGPVVEYSTGTGTNPRDLVAADFNGDGASDLAVMNDSAEGVAILLATGTGVFQAPTSLAVGTYPRAIAAADLNADGKIDLAVTNVGEQLVSILLGTGKGSFLPRKTFALPPGMLSIAVGHFNNDAHADLAVSGFSLIDPPQLAILAGAGNGTFASPTVVAAITTNRLETLDYNHDGKDDLAALASGVTLLTGNGDGTFQAQVTPPIDGSAFAKGDFNSDGWIDFAVTRSTTVEATHRMALFLGNSTGLERVPAYPGAYAPTAVTAGDFNHDGHSDLAIGDNSTRSYPDGSISVLLALSDGSLSAPTTYLTGFQPYSIRTADFNGDGHLDLACANSFFVSVLLGIGNGFFSAATNYGLSGSATVSGIDLAEFNNDGIVDIVSSSFDGVTIVFGDGHGAFGPPSTHPLFSAGVPVTADFNLDGKADVAMAGYRILFGDGAGHLSDPVYVEAGLFVLRFVVDDFNADGRPDFAGVSTTGGGAVLLGQPTGGFGTPIPFPVDHDSYVQIALAVGDFDRDGKKDLAVLSGGSVSVLRGNNDGTFANVGDSFVAFLASDLVTADFNADGRHDLAAIRETYSDAPLPSDVFLLINTNCLPRRLGMNRNLSLCNLPGSPFDKHPVVGVYDDGDNVVSCAAGTVQASILPGTGTPGATLQGTTSIGVAAGLATFSNLSVNLVGQGYVLQFSRAGVVSTRSREFRVEPGCKGPFNFFTLAPCRVADTRDAPGIWGAPALAVNTTRVFPIAGRCGIPITARSVAANITVVNPTAAGHLTLFPAGRPVPLASTLNFRPGIIRANNAVLSLGDEGDAGVLCTMPANPANHADFLIDVTGYFE